MKNDRLGDKTRIEHIREAIELIESWTEKVDFESFSANMMLLSACLRQLEIIGEASNHLSDTLQKAHPHVDWPNVISLRNLLAHEYFGVNPLVIWEIIRNDLPTFQTQIEKIYQEL